MKKHRIVISMEDTDIEKEIATLIITTKDSLKTVSDKLDTSFYRYDSGDGVAMEYREAYGWGTEGFIEYLKHRYRRSWTIKEEIPDETFRFIGM